MLRLKAMDGVRLLDAEGAAIDEVLARPLRLALLAYLAFARPLGPQRRDRLAVVFWPEHSHDRARHSLCQAVYGLRGALGPDVVESRGSEELRVNPLRLESDVGQFWSAIDDGDLPRAVALHRTPLLTHFHLRHSGEFERWLDDERRSVARVAFNAARRLLEGTLSANDLAWALHWAEAARRIQPFSEAATRWVMALLSLQGRRVEAMELFHTFRARLNRELELDPGREIRALAERIRLDSLEASQVDWPRPLPPSALRSP